MYCLFVLFSFSWPFYESNAENVPARFKRHGFKEVENDIAKWVREGGDVNVRSYGRKGDATLLQATAYEGDEYSVKILLENGADPNLKGDFLGHRTPLDLAVEYEKEHIIKMLLDYGADPNLKNHLDDTSLHLASTENIAKMLLEKGADLHIEGKNSDTPLERSARKGREDVFLFLLQRGAKISASYSRGAKLAASSLKWEYLLFEAASSGYEQIVKTCLEHGVDPHTNNLQTQTLINVPPLHAATRKGHENIVKMLLDYGADPNKQHPHIGDTPLHVAVERNNESIVRILLEKGAKPNIPSLGRVRKTYSSADQIEPKGYYPLHLAVENENENIVKLLLDYGADPNKKDKDDFTPLHWASAKENEKIFQMLLDSGAKDVKFFYLTAKGDTEKVTSQTQQEETSLDECRDSIKKL